MTPQIREPKVLEILHANDLSLSTQPVQLVIIEGYYLDSMGKVGRNDRGIWDDALIWITPTAYQAFQGNTDPSRYRAGVGSGSNKGIATLAYGKHTYRPGTHKGKPGFFRPADKVRIYRDGPNGTSYIDHISDANIHNGSITGGTSSLGCQTIPYFKWKEFRDLGYSELQKYFPARALEARNFPVLKIKETDIRKGYLKVSA